jgi:hypothetical protein
MRSPCSLYMYVLLSLLGNRLLLLIMVKYHLSVSPPNYFFLCAVRVVSKESSRVVLPGTSSYNVEFLTFKLVVLMHHLCLIRISRCVQWPGLLKCSNWMIFWKKAVAPTLYRFGKVASRLFVLLSRVSPQTSRPKPRVVHIVIWMLECTMFITLQFSGSWTWILGTNCSLNVF